MFTTAISHKYMRRATMIYQNLQGLSQIKKEMMETMIRFFGITIAMRLVGSCVF